MPNQFQASPSGNVANVPKPGIDSNCKTHEINQALSDAYLKYQGLYALRDGWIKHHHSQ